MRSAATRHLPCGDNRAVRTVTTSHSFLSIVALPFITKTAHTQYCNPFQFLSRSFLWLVADSFITKTVHPP